MFVSKPEELAPNVSADAAQFYAGARTYPRLSARKTLCARKVRAIIAANTNAPHATCATVNEIIGFNGCGSFGDAARAKYVAIPNPSCTNNKLPTMIAGRARYLSEA